MKDSMNMNKECVSKKTKKVITIDIIKEKVKEYIIEDIDNSEDIKTIQKRLTNYDTLLLYLINDSLSD